MFQVLALIPGTSRSGATILGAIMIGASRYVAAEFSFFLGIPTMFGASALKIFKFLKDGNAFDFQGTVILLTGTIVSSRVFDYHTVNNINRTFGVVDDGFKTIINIFPFNDFQHIRFVCKQRFLHF